MDGVANMITRDTMFVQSCYILITDKAVKVISIHNLVEVNTLLESLTVTLTAVTVIELVKSE
jgi:hypothetical protein